MPIQFEDVVSLGSVSMFGFVLAASTAFAKLVWWLSDQFKTIQENLTKLLDSHEQLDQRRHEDNIIRFTKIETKLDTVIKNGNH